MVPPLLADPETLIVPVRLLPAGLKSVQSVEDAHTDAVMMHNASFMRPGWTHNTELTEVRFPHRFRKRRCVCPSLQSDPDLCSSQQFVQHILLRQPSSKTSANCNSKDWERESEHLTLSLRLSQSQSLFHCFRRYPELMITTWILSFWFSSLFTAIVRYSPSIKAWLYFYDRVTTCLEPL